MAGDDSFTPGVPRTESMVATGDPVRDQMLDPVGASRAWTPFGLKIFGHTIGVNVATGGLSISATDLAMPYYAMPFRVLRTLDTQEQYIQSDQIASHPNTDPRPHLFGNWQFQQETAVSPIWESRLPELLIADGDGESAAFCREFPNFDIAPVAGLQDRLCSYGVPRRTLQALGWADLPGSCCLRTTRGTFGILAGSFTPETMLDRADFRLWRFEPLTGMGHRYSSEFSFGTIGADDRREVSPPCLLTASVDGMGHSITFAPTAGVPPFRSYRLSDGSGRSFRLDLNEELRFRDGDTFGGYAKCFLVSQAVDETRLVPIPIRYTYDDGRLIQVIYPGHAGGADRIVTYSYDTLGNLCAITDPVANSLTIDYVLDLLDADDRLEPRLKVARIADSEGNSVTYAYDHPAGRVSVTTSDAKVPSSTITFSYLVDDRDTKQRYLTKSEIHLSAGFDGSAVVAREWIYPSDGSFLLAQEVDPLGVATQFEYNSFNQLTAIVDGAGHRTEFFYDIPAAPSPANPVRYDLLRLVESRTDLTGVVTKIERKRDYRRYDKNSTSDSADFAQSTHRISSATDANGNTTTYGYDDLGSFNSILPTLIIDALGGRSFRTVDATGRILLVTDATGVAWSNAYNVQGQIFRSTDPNGNDTFFTYDSSSGWLTDITDALATGALDPAHTWHFKWDDAGQLERKIDPLGDRTDYLYFRNQRVRAVLQFQPATRQTTLQWTASGKLSQIEDPSSHRTCFTYDEDGRLFATYRDSPTNATTSCIRNAAGRVTVLTDRNGQQSFFTYDLLGRLVGAQEPSWPADSGSNPGKRIAIRYDELGQRLSVSDSQLPSVGLYEYDAVGNLTARTDGFGVRISYTYDACNNLISVEDETGAIDLRFKRDASGEISRVRDGTFLDPGRSFEYIRSAAGQVGNLYEIVFDSSGTTSTFQYDANRRLASVDNLVAGSRHLTYQYARQADGLIARVSGSKSAEYSFDGLKRLISESDSGMTLGYDEVGNILRRLPNASPPGMVSSYDGDNRLTSMPAMDTVMSYDENGNQLTQTRGNGAVITFVYDGANRLASVDTGTVKVSYVYDIDGRLVQRGRVNGSEKSLERYLYAINSILAITDKQGAIDILYTRDASGRLLRRRARPSLVPTPSRDPHSLYYLRDGLGNCVRLIDWNGRSTQDVDYNAWGAPLLQSTVAPRDIFRYRSGYQDVDTGLLKFGQRWYDPSQYRWLSQDPVETLALLANGDLGPAIGLLSNLYAYASNNPVNFADATGLGSFMEWLRNTIGATTLGQLADKWAEEQRSSDQKISDRKDVITEREESSKPGGSKDKPPEKDPSENGDQAPGGGSSADKFLIILDLMLMLMLGIEGLKNGDGMIGTPITASSDDSTSSDSGLDSSLAPSTAGQGAAEEAVA